MWDVSIDPELMIRMLIVGYCWHSLGAAACGPSIWLIAGFVWVSATAMSRSFERFPNSTTAVLTSRLRKLFGLVVALP